MALVCRPPAIFLPTPLSHAQTTYPRLAWGGRVEWEGRCSVVRQFRWGGIVRIRAEVIGCQDETRAAPAVFKL